MELTNANDEHLCAQHAKTNKSCKEMIFYNKKSKKCGCLKFGAKNPLIRVHSKGFNEYHIIPGTQ